MDTKFKIVINSGNTFTTIMNNECIIQLINLLNCKNYHISEDCFGHTKFTIDTNMITRKISLPELMFDKDVKEINVQNFPFDIWKIKISQVDIPHKQYIHNDMNNPAIKNGILYKPNEAEEIITYIRLKINYDYMLEKDCFEDIDEYTDYILDKYNSGVEKLYDWAVSLLQKGRMNNVIY